MDEWDMEFQAKRATGAKDTEQEMDSHVVPAHLLALLSEIPSFGLWYHLLSRVFVSMQTLAFD